MAKKKKKKAAPKNKAKKKAESVASRKPSKKDMDMAHTLLLDTFGCMSPDRWRCEFGTPFGLPEPICYYVNLIDMQIWTYRHGVWGIRCEPKPKPKPPTPKLGKKELQVLLVAVQRLRNESAGSAIQAIQNPWGEFLGLHRAAQSSAEISLVESMAGFTLRDLESKLSRMIDGK